MWSTAKRRFPVSLIWRWQGLRGRCQKNGRCRPYGTWFGPGRFTFRKTRWISLFRSIPDPERVSSKSIPLMIVKSDRCTPREDFLLSIRFRSKSPRKQSIWKPYGRVARKYETGRPAMNYSRSPGFVTAPPSDRYGNCLSEKPRSSRFSFCLKPWPETRTGSY